MGSLRTRQLFHAALLWLCLPLPLLLCENLHCYYSPVLEKEITFELVVTECPPNEMCFKGLGRYGNYTALSARGCMLEKDCSQVHSLRLLGTVYTMSYSCCDWPYCNRAVALEPLTAMLVAAAVVACSFCLT
ncbi:protein Bouncer isoform X1 [Oryzias latipes]|uniref:Protein Bouncer n=1 Tax=Oryzias latipes TaxID=8090 RepID=BNCR_ORYLA|nr:RecName: Full=Protein Bouncer; Flags: Precursor [Oryzias latipes]